MTFGFPNIDPSKLDPKTLMELSKLIRELSHDKLLRLQTLMHNMSAGFDVSKEMAEFEKELPPGFKEKVAALLLTQQAPSASTSSSPSSVHEARLTVLRAVAEGRVTPEEAEKTLFPG